MVVSKIDLNIKARYLQQVKQIHPNIKIFSKYLGQAKKITLYCNRCKHTFTQQARVVLRSNNKWGCPYCNRIENAKKHIIDPKIAIKRVTDRFPYIIYILGYQRSTSKPLFYCNNCKSYFRAKIFNIIKSRYGCLICSRIHMNDDKRLTNATFKQRIAKMYPNLKIIDTYQSNIIAITFLCKLCQHQFKASPSCLYSRQYGCPYCRDNLSHPKNAKYFNQHDFITELKYRLPSFVLRSPFKSYHKQIKLQCKRCLYIWTTTPRNAFHRNLNLCPRCMKWKQQSLKLNCVKLYKQSVRNKYSNETYYHYCNVAIVWYVRQKTLSIQILSLFNGTTNNIKIRCKECGFKRSILADTLLKAPTCPNCNRHFWSHGERTIANILSQYNISYIHSFKPYTLIDQYVLHFDFKIGSHILLEYQGKQHYQPIDYFGGKESFARQQKHDRMKRAWAKQNGYLLIEIRYNQNIKDIMLPLISLLTGDMTVGNDN